MPKLGEFIGVLLSDAAKARVRADLEAITIAELYSQSELLRHLPVPRFRLPEITIDFPVVVPSGQEDALAGGGEKIFDEPTKQEVSKAIDQALAKGDVRLTNAQSAALRNAASATLSDALKEGPQVLLAPHRVSNDVAASVLKTIHSMPAAATMEPQKLEQLTQRVSDSVRSLLLNKLVRTPQLEVRVSGTDIKAHGDASSLMRVRVTITEDAYEVVQRDGEDAGFLLVPE